MLKDRYTVPELAEETGLPLKFVAEHAVPYLVKKGLRGEDGSYSSHAIKTLLGIKLLLGDVPSGGVLRRLVVERKPYEVASDFEGGEPDIGDYIDARDGDAVLVSKVTDIDKIGPITIYKGDEAATIPRGARVVTAKTVALRKKGEKGPPTVAELDRLLANFLVRLGEDLTKGDGPKNAEELFGKG